MYCHYESRHVLKTDCLKTTVFWDMKPGPIFLDYSEDGGSKVLRKVGTYTRVYTITITEAGNLHSHFCEIPLISHLRCYSHFALIPFENCVIIKNFRTQNFQQRHTQNLLQHYGTETPGTPV